MCIKLILNFFQSFYFNVFKADDFEYTMFSSSMYRLGGVVEERPPRQREVAGSIPGRVIRNTFKIVVITDLLGAQDCGISIRTDLLV